MNTSAEPSVPFGLQHFGSPLQVLKQTSPNQERVSCNGLQKTVHVVVKNAPFTVQIGLINSMFMGQILDLNHFTFDCILLYDTDTSEKGVDYVKIKPLEFKPTVNEAGNRLTLEVRIKVLTSHHENNFFRVKIVLLEPTTGQQFHPALVTYSEPVKVISKPEQMKKSKQPSNRKRSANDILLDTITRIQQQQQEQQRLIEKLLTKKAEKSSAIHGVQPQQSLNTQPKLERKDCDSEFDSAFRLFFDLYNSLPQEEKPVKIRKLVRNSSSHDTERIAEFLDLFMTEGLQRSLRSSGVHTSNTPSSLSSSSSSSSSGCKCAACPYQRELERIDEFYGDFLSTTTLETEEKNLLFS